MDEAFHWDSWAPQIICSNPESLTEPLQQWGGSDQVWTQGSWGLRPNWVGDVNTEDLWNTKHVLPCASCLKLHVCVVVFKHTSLFTSGTWTRWSLKRWKRFLKHIDAFSSSSHLPSFWRTTCAFKHTLLPFQVFLVAQCSYFEAFWGRHYICSYRIFVKHSLPAFLKPESVNQTEWNSYFTLTVWGLITG